MAVEAFHQTLGPDGAITDRTRAYMLRSLLARVESKIFALDHMFEHGPPCSMAERLRRILIGASQGGKLDPQDYRVVWELHRMAQKWEASLAAEPAAPAGQGAVPNGGAALGSS